MASHTISGQRWADGTAVSVYLASAWPDSSQAPAGMPVASGVVSAASVTFSGLTEDVRYVAYAGGIGVRFLVPAASESPTLSDRNRIYALEGRTTAVEGRATSLEGRATSVESRTTTAEGRLDRQPLNAKDNGLVGDGSTIENTALTALLPTAANRTLKFPKGTYKFTAGFGLPDGIDVDLTDGATLDFSGAPTSTVLFTAAGTEAAAVNLAGNAVKGATSLSVAAGAEAGFAAGDYIRVGSTVLFDPGRTNQPIGEIVIVLSTASGVINLRSPLVGGPYNTADTATVAKITMLRNTRVRGGKIIGGGPGAQHEALKFDRVVGVRVFGTEFDLCENQAIQCQDCIDAVIDDVHVERSNRSGLGYGVEFDNCCQDCTVSNSFFRDCRHGTTSGGSTSRKGLPRRLNFKSNHVWDTTDVGMDNHAAGEDMTYVGNTIVDAGTVGININCPSAIVKENTIIRSGGAGILCRNYTIADTDYLVADNRVEFPTGIGVQVISSAIGTGSTTDGITVRGNHVLSSPLQGVQIAIITDTFRLTDVLCSNNKIRACGSYAIQLIKVDNASVLGNICKDVPATNTAIYLNDVTQADVTGNVVSFVSLSTGTGILASPTTDVGIGRNTIVNAGTGINVASTSTWTSVVKNNLRNCTTPYALSTGAGNWAEGNTPGVVATIASAATITLVGSENGVYKISGTTTINTITATSMAGKIITLIFLSTANLADGVGNLKLTGTIIPTADDVVQLASDGTSWYQVAPIAVN